MLSWELIDNLTNKKIVSAELVASGDVSPMFKDKEAAKYGGDSEHLKLVLDSGFVICLPYQKATMYFENAKDNI